MSDFSKIFELSSAKLHQPDHSRLLKTLLDSFAEGGSAAVEAKIKEILSAIEEE